MDVVLPPWKHNGDRRCLIYLRRRITHLSVRNESTMGLRNKSAQSSPKSEATMTYRRQGTATAQAAERSVCEPVVSPGKLSKGLASRLESVSADDMIDIVVELEPPASKPTNVSATVAQFKETSEPVTGTIEETGGKVLGTAWINSTVRARIPASAITRVAALQHVERIDVPNALIPEGL